MILVAGAGGFIGTAVVEALRAHRPGDEVVGVTRALADLADPRAVAALLEKVRPERVIHLASSMRRGADPTSTEAQWRDTFDAGRHLIEAAARAGVRQLLISGTTEELGWVSGVLGPELPAAPRTTYGLCKALLKEVAELHARDGRMRVDWVRPFTVYGPGQRGQMLIPYACEMASSGRPCEITDGLQQRDFLYIDDLARWFGLACQVDLATPAPGRVTVHHVGSGIPTRVRDVLEMIQAAFPGADFRFGARPRRPEEPALQVAPTAGALARWSAEIGWRDGVTRTIAWWRGLAPG